MCDEFADIGGGEDITPETNFDNITDAIPMETQEPVSLEEMASGEYDDIQGPVDLDALAEETAGIPENEDFDNITDEVPIETQESVPLDESTSGAYNGIQGPVDLEPLAEESAGLPEDENFDNITDAVPIETQEPVSLDEMASGEYDDIQGPVDLNTYESGNEETESKTASGDSTDSGKGTAEDSDEEVVSTASNDTNGDLNSKREPDSGDKGTAETPPETKNGESAETKSEEKGETKQESDLKVDENGKEETESKTASDNLTDSEKETTEEGKENSPKIAEEDELSEDEKPPAESGEEHELTEEGEEVGTEISGVGADNGQDELTIQDCVNNLDENFWDKNFTRKDNFVLPDGVTEADYENLLKELEEQEEAKERKRKDAIAGIGLGTAMGKSLFSSTRKLMDNSSRNSFVSNFAENAIGVIAKGKKVFFPKELEEGQTDKNKFVSASRKFFEIMEKYYDAISSVKYNTLEQTNSTTRLAAGGILMFVPDVNDAWNKYQKEIKSATTIVNDIGQTTISHVKAKPGRWMTTTWSALDIKQQITVLAKEHCEKLSNNNAGDLKNPYDNCMFWINEYGKQFAAYDKEYKLYKLAKNKYPEWNWPKPAAPNGFKCIFGINKLSNGLYNCISPLRDFSKADYLNGEGGGILDRGKALFE